MVREFSESISTPEPEAEFESRTAFLGLVEAIGPDQTEGFLARGEEAVRDGLRGAAALADDYSLRVVVDEDSFHFSIEGWGPYRVSHDHVKGVIAEVREERRNPSD